MANKQAWIDFERMKRNFENSTNLALEIVNGAKRFEHDKIEIIDNLTRRNELKKITDVHPDFNLTTFGQFYTKIMAIKNYIETNL